MAIEKCPDCSNEISSTAKTCPNVGIKLGQLKYQRLRNGCGVILLIIILIAVIEIFYKQMPYDQNKINKEKIIDSLSLGKPEVICNCLSSLKFKKKESGQQTHILIFMARPKYFIIVIMSGIISQQKATIYQIL